MLNRRTLLKSATAAALGAAASEARAEAPPSTFDEPTARFEPARAEAEPAGAFARELPRPATLRPTAVAPREAFDDPNTGVQPFGPTDPLPIGDGFHGVAREWAETPAHWAGYGCDPSETDPHACWGQKMRAFGTVPAHDPEAVGGTRVANWGGSRSLLPSDVPDAADVACFPVKCFKIHMEERAIQLPGMPHPTLFHAYGGTIPGPTLRMRLGQPTVVRFQNHLDTETSIHFHGGHNPSHADGFPTFYVLPGKTRDYFYPNILPLLKRKDEEPAAGAEREKTPAGYLPDIGEGQSTCWYHDHGMDCTAYNVAKGLAGFALVFGEHELKLIADRVLPGLGKRSCRDPELNSLGDAASLEDPRKPGFYKPGAEPYHNPYDIPIVIQDRVFDRRTGQIAYDATGHNGYLGDTFLLNGQERPFLRMKNRKHRLRFLNGSNARVYRLRILTEADYHARVHGRGLRAEFAADVEGEDEVEAAPRRRGGYDETAVPFLRIGKDSWLWPNARAAKSVLIAPANRADLVVDFKELTKGLKRGDRAVFYLVNTMPQRDGRGPKLPLDDPGDPRVLPLPFDAVDPGDGEPRPVKVAELDRPIGLMKIIVEGPPARRDATVADGTELNPREPIRDDEVEAVREFIFERGKGAWMISGRFYDPTISNACPTHDTAEEWVLRNGGGGWWHPIHIHLESHQLVSYMKDFDADEVVDPRDPPAAPVLSNLVEVLDQMPEGDQVGLHDTQVLGPNTVARIRMRFRTWSGPFVFHCHNLEHEDMRMMFNFEPVPRPDPDASPDDRRRQANIAPDARTHGVDMTWQPDPAVERVGELEWEYPPVPATPARDAAEHQIPPRPRDGKRDPAG
ncbi:multicopper oxidase domain-containing protein [Paludisphaera sp.]|uniref:multicopper oxidase family protein n=1 Tax=Paludisphaera sp. TaxID=2017432 RepID=UPI00301C41B2